MKEIIKLICIAVMIAVISAMIADTADARRRDRVCCARGGDTRQFEGDRRYSAREKCRRWGGRVVAMRDCRDDRGRDRDPDMCQLRSGKCVALWTARQCRKDGGRVVPRSRCRRRGMSPDMGILASRDVGVRL